MRWMWFHFYLLPLKNSISDRQNELHQFLYIESRYVFFLNICSTQFLNSNVGQTPCMHRCMEAAVVHCWRIFFPILPRHSNSPTPITHMANERLPRDGPLRQRRCICWTTCSHKHPFYAMLLVLLLSMLSACVCEKKRKQTNVLSLYLSLSLTDTHTTLLFFSWLFLLLLLSHLLGKGGGTGGEQRPNMDPSQQKE